MKDELQYFLKIILIGFVNGQAFPNRQFVEGPPPPPQPLPFIGNQRFFSEAEMSPYSRPPRPMMYRDEGPQTPILYRQDNVPPPLGPPLGPPVGPPMGPPVGSPVGPPVGPPIGPPLIRNYGFQPQPTFFDEEGLQSPPVFFRENLIRAKPNFYREEEVSPPKPVLYQQPSFQPIIPEVYRGEPIQQNPMIYREENLFSQSPTFQPQDRYQTSSQIFGGATKEPQPSAPLPHSDSLPQTNQNNSKPKSLLTKNRAKNCHPSVLSPLKMNIEPSKENFNTLRTALRIPLKEPASISDRDKVLPTIIIQEDAKSQAKDKDNHKVYLEDDYSDHYVDDSPSSLPEPTLPNYPYQYFQAVKLCKSNGMVSSTTSPSTPCFPTFKNDLENIIPVLRSPITILPSRFPPGIERIIEKIQRYFSTYNHLESNQRPLTKPTTPHTSTSTHSPPSSSSASNIIVTKPTTDLSSNVPNAVSVSVSTMPIKTNQTFPSETSTPSNLEKPVQLLEPISQKPNVETAPVTTSGFVNSSQAQVLPQKPAATEPKFEILRDASGFATVEDQKPISSLQTSTESAPTTVRTLQTDFDEIKSQTNPQPQQDVSMNEIGQSDDESSTVFSSTSSTKTETIEIVDETQTTTTRSESTMNNCRTKTIDDDSSGDHSKDETTTTAATNATTC